MSPVSLSLPSGTIISWTRYTSSSPYRRQSPFISPSRPRLRRSTPVGLSGSRNLQKLYLKGIRMAPSLQKKTTTWVLKIQLRS
uniref:Uncharacterized protein n=1 Tax=Arundo donax TaxID=35708 RepID=A0A0A9E1G7_ARUDO